MENNNNFQSNRFEIEEKFYFDIDKLKILTTFQSWFFFVVQGIERNPTGERSGAEGLMASMKIKNI